VNKGVHFGAGLQLLLHMKNV